MRERRGVLQLLAPEHADCEDTDESDKNPGALIRVLGGTSGKDVDKRFQCEKLGYVWSTLDGDGSRWPSVLPRCIYYLQLELEGDMIDCGSHEVALCRVVSMTSGNSIENAATELDYISTRKLRQMGVITELGRVADAAS